MNKLFIISHKYPYSPPCEQFLHNEIPYLAEKFDDLYIMPVSHEAKGDTQLNDYSNVHICNIKRKKRFLEIVMVLFSHCIFHLCFYIDLLKIMKRGRIFSKKYLKMLFSSYVNDVIVYRNLKSILKSITFEDRIIIYTYWLGGLGGVMLKEKYSKKGYNIKTISRAHGTADIFITSNTKGFRPKHEFLINGIDCIYSISKAGKDYLINDGFLAEKIVVSHLGVEPQKSIISTEKGKKRFSIVSCSMMVGVKRIEMIINTLSLLKNYEIEWNHFGDGPLFSTMKELAKEKLGNNIYWIFHGNVSSREICNFYLEKKPDVFINVSMSEGIPVSIMEAASCGIPIIATNVGGNSEICFDNVNGFLVDSNAKCDGIAEIIREFINLEENEILRFRRNSEEIYNSLFNAKQNFECFANSILSVK